MSTDRKGAPERREDLPAGADRNADGVVHRADLTPSTPARTRPICHACGAPVPSHKPDCDSVS